MDLQLLQKLIEMMGKSNLSALEVQDQNIRIRLENQGGIGQKSIPLPVETSPALAEVTPVGQITSPVSEAPKAEVIADDSVYSFIKSPIVGTFYPLSESGKGSINVGDKVKKGQVVCTVEAMKLMNEIESDCDGEVVEILAYSGDMVEFGQPLIKLK